MVSPAGQNKNDTHRLSLDCCDQLQLGVTRCTWPWGHCLLSELRSGRRQTGFCEWNTRNRWRDGQVCPDVDKRTMAPWARQLCVLACYANRKKEETRKTGKKENEQNRRKKELEKRRADRLRKRRRENPRVFDP
ncbi:hypothetical protein TNCV_3760491 [Trichonephila clavipes]|nr:hypothetical protein TNCV_3760491 [Trichonephila clavipes]